MKNVTYLLGAGASYHALPIVNELSDQMYHWANKIAESDFDINFKEQQCDIFRKYGSQHNDFGTIDTYARSLFLQGDKVKELSDLKMYLSLFFLLEQFRSDKPTYLKNNNRKSDTPNLNGPYNLEYIDHRYMALMSKLLSQNKNNPLPENVSFISWNYDIQLELACRKLLGMDEKDIKDIFTTLQVYPNFKSKEDPAKVVHLNGIAGLYQKDNIDSKLYELFHEVANRPELTGIEEKTFNHIFTTDHDCRIYDSMLNFSWENNENSKRAKTLSRHISEKTDVLIVIGYSFPTFNHTVDVKILSELPKETKIIIQDPSVDKEYFCERFSIDAKRVKIMRDVKQFYIPPELFNNL
jgi:hypothetical protein